MEIMVSVLVAFLILYLVWEAWLGIKRALSKPKAEPKRREGKELTFKKLWLDVDPAPFKVFVFAESKYEGRLVMHGPYEGVVTRLLLLWKGDKHRCIKLDALCGIGITEVEKEYATSLTEAKKVAQAVYGKKEKPKTTAAAELAVPQPKAVAPPVPVVVAEQKVEVAVKQAPVAAMPVQPEAPVLRDVPIVKGFKSQFVGTIVDAGMQKHVTTRNGHPEEYETFTLTLNTQDGPEHITGNDLRRALADAGVKKGDNIRAIYLKDVDLPSGFRKKVYQVVKLPSGA